MNRSDREHFAKRSVRHNTTIANSSYCKSFFGKKCTTPNHLQRHTEV